nr:CHAT domain-containing protein [Mastigocoleus sp. MO_167.B18]
DIQSLIDERTAIVEWYITGEKILTFFVTHHHPEPQVWQSSTEDLTNLVNWEKEYLESYDTNLQQWIIELETRLQKLAKILHLDKIISLVPKECSRLILIPHLLLHIFPLHALPVSPQLGRRAGGEGKYLLDLFPRGVQYAPSCQLLKLAQNQQRPDFRNLFAIQNPTEDLIYTDLEVETIRSFFPNAEVLAKESASEASLKLHQNLPLANCVHFSCHGTFNTISPLESHLVLAEDEANTEDGYLTLAEIFELSLQQCRLVTLSACETGFILPSLSDEYIGLPNGFLFAGSPSVVSSLWTVNDLSTAFLMIKFYQNLTSGGGGVPVAIALQTAQQWLRDATKEKLQEWVKKLSLNSTKKGTIRRQINYKMTGEKPFNSPYHWAAFTAVGK